MASDGARTARLLALMAGNSFAFLKIFDHFDAIVKDRSYPWLTLTIIAVPMVGVACAFLALAGSSISRVARIAERISLFLITIMMVVVLWIAAARLGIVGISTPGIP
jgi:hypothetical protein